ncbi:uncharacterized protein A4U43_C07F24560 [Asparagus officinalis]|uniref:protein-serine/threonine phosphatase n=1 Tax=Asparagus officinalis TaxID=4686 RepID=A0A5P1EJU6_ASPOF|nr:uncharacterized protein A4U43_C07F24560 [Asparagus officinalis]
MKTVLEICPSKTCPVFALLLFSFCFRCSLSVDPQLSADSNRQMVLCIARLRNLIARSPAIDRFNLRRDLGLDHASSDRLILFPRSRRSFRATATMMVDSSGATTGTGPVVVGGLKERDCVNDGGYVCGGWMSNNGRLSCGYSSFRGRRPSMEDFYDMKTSKIDGETVNLFGVFDGHGGSRAAEYLKAHLFENLMKHPQFMTDTKTALSETYKKTDSDFLNVERNILRDDGSTASTAVLIGNHLYVANVGDSRAVMSKAGKAIPLSDDHKPNRSDERHRIELAGGVITWAGTWRVGGVLAMSRAFGNRQLKRFVVADPEIQDAISIASMEEEAEAAALKLMETAFSRGSADNITCIVVRYSNAQTHNQSRASTIDDMANFAVMTVGNSFLPAFKSGFEDQSTDAAARISFKYGCSRGVYGTPFFFVNGFALPDAGSALDYKTWTSVIDPLVKKQKKKGVEDLLIYL